MIDAYNTANSTSFTTDIMELGKTEGGALSGFTFFDADRSTVITEAAVNSPPIAYFKYDGLQDLLYYSVKGDSKIGFSLYTYMPGAFNKLSLFDNEDKDISHVTFLKGRSNDQTPPVVPNLPASLFG